MPENQVEQLSDPKWWFDTIVEPNYEEYCSEPLSRRKAVNAIVTTYHFYERLYHFEKQQAEAAGHNYGNECLFRKKLCKECEKIVILQDVVNAVKHQLRLSSPVSIDTLVSSSSGVTKETSVGLEIEGTGGLLVTDVLKDVMDFWQTKLPD